MYRMSFISEITLQLRELIPNFLLIRLILRTIVNLRNRCHLGQYCMLGSGCKVSPGTIIQDYTIAAMGSVIHGDTKDNYVLIGGNPATAIKG